MRTSLLVIASVSLIAACGDDNAGPGERAAPDAQPTPDAEFAPDAAHDVAADVMPDSGGEPDAVADSGADTQDGAGDTTADVPDMREDVPPDTPRPPAPPWQQVVSWDSFPSHPFRAAVEEGAFERSIVRAAGSDRVLSIGTSGVAILDPMPNGELAVAWNAPLPASAYGGDLSPDGELAVVAGGPLHVLGISDLAEGTVASLELPVSVYAVALSPDAQTAYAVGRNALFVVDLTDPEQPELRATLDVGSLNGVIAMADGRTIAAFGYAGLVIIDVGDIDRPAILARRLEGEGTVNAVVSDGDTLFVSRHTQVLVFDVARRDAPILQGDLDTPHYLYGLTFLRSGVLVAVGGGAVHLIDVADVTEPVVLGAYEVTAAAAAAGLLDGVRIAVSSGYGVSVIDTRHPASAPLIGSIGHDDGCGQAADVAVTLRGAAAYVAADDLIVVEIGDGGSPGVAQTVPGEFTNVHVVDAAQTVFAASGAELARFRHSYHNLAESAVFDQPGRTPMDVAASRDGLTAYLVTEAGGGLEVVDFTTDPPTQIANHYIRHTRSVVLTNFDRTLFVADPYENGLVAFNVEDPAAPAMIGRLPVVVGELVACSDDRTLIATTRDGLSLIDVDDPTAPRIIGEFELPGAQDVAMGASCERIFATDQTALYILDASDKTAPRLAATFDIPGVTTGVAVSTYERRALVSTSESATCLGIVDIRARPSLTLADTGPDGALSFHFSWPDRYPAFDEQIAWHATTGEVTITEIDQDTHTAVVRWSPGAPEARLTIAVGNHHYAELAHATP